MLYLHEVNCLVYELIWIQEIVYLFLCQRTDWLLNLFDNFLFFFWCLIIFTAFTELIKRWRFILNFFRWFFRFFNHFSSFSIFYLFLIFSIFFFRLIFSDSLHRSFFYLLWHLFRLLLWHVHKLVWILISQLSLLAWFNFFLLRRNKTLYIAINWLQRRTVTREDITDFNHLAVFHLVP